MTGEGRPGDGPQQIPHLGRDQVGAQDENRAVPIISGRFKPGSVRSDQRFQSNLEILDV